MLMYQHLKQSAKDTYEDNCYQVKLVLFCLSVQHHNYYFVECGHVWFALNRIGWPVPGVQ